MKKSLDTYVKCLIMAALFVLIGPAQGQGCDKNVFFKIDIPEGWVETCVHPATEKNTNLPAISMEYCNSDESQRYQYSYVIIMKGDVDGKQYIPLHVSKDLDTTITEPLCYYKEENFHGLPALSYTFGGTTHGVNNVGKIYFVKAKGFSIIFVNYFMPNKSGMRHEIDVWKTLQWLPQDQWRI
ncbi:MAG: hypothetical protein K2N91_04890 [Muribaculaceae bacterium]|nr:hypothetical protein [Muribaculaceae bacterium]